MMRILQKVLQDANKKHVPKSESRLWMANWGAMRGSKITQPQLQSRLLAAQLLSDFGSVGAK
jgi:hypothetical protein